MRHICKILVVVFVSILLGATASLPTGACDPAERASGNVALRKEAAIVIAKGLGRLEVKIYAGGVVGDKFCVLTVYSQEFSGDGIFDIQIFEPHGQLYTGNGKRLTLRGADDATIWECRLEFDNISWYFIHDTEEEKLFWIDNDV